MAEKTATGRLVEWLFVKLAGVRHIGEGNLFRYSLARHEGKDLTLADGAAVRKGDRLLELHLDNDRVAELRDESDGERRLALALVHVVRSSLADIAAMVARDHPQIVALHANTPDRFAPVAVREGFEQRARERGIETWVIARLQRGVLRDYDPEGYARLEAAGMTPQPVEIWMSRETLMARHLRPPGAGAAGRHLRPSGEIGGEGRAAG